jgi:hypothetical protein
MLLFSTSSCFKEENPIIPPGETPDKIRNKLDKERLDYLAHRKIVCLTNLLVKAEDHVDSILADSIKVRIVEGLYFPPRPIRPNHIGNVRLNDSIKVGPILK